ncbi:MAG: PAS domain-containing protein [Balneolaceae bacterium]
MKKQKHTEEESRRNREQGISEQGYLNSNSYLKTLIENTLDIIMVLSCDGTIRFLSKSAEKIVGNQPDIVMGSNIIDFIHPREREDFKSRFSNLVNDKKNTDYSEFKIRHRNGEIRYIESIAKKINDPDGEPCIMVNARDVTERNNVQKILEKSQKQLSIAQKIAQVGSWEWDINEDVVRCSKELQRIYGVNKSKEINDREDFLKYLHQGDREYFIAVIENALKSKSTFQVEYRIVRTDEVVRKMLSKGEVVCDKRGDPKKIIASGQDITDLKKAEHQLLEYSEQLKNYNIKQDMIIENERVQIARDIHDELGQVLAVLKMDIYLLKERAKQEIGDKFSAGITEDIRSIFKRFDTLINSVQRITTNLRPEVIDDLELGEAIKWQCKDFEEKTGIQCNYINDSESLKDMIKEYKNAIYRILQQALKNVKEHAGATKAKVKLKLNDSFLTLKVWDNGAGIKDEEVLHPNSLGLLSMRERSHYLGGDISIVGKEKEGTTVILKIPVDEIIFKY